MNDLAVVEMFSVIIVLDEQKQPNKDENNY
jgi:hypothetical protein